jgi:hypothetical protein
MKKKSDHFYHENDLVIYFLSFKNFIAEGLFLI